MGVAMTTELGSVNHMLIADIKCTRRTMLVLHRTRGGHRMPARLDLSSGVKTCTTCNQSKSLGEFYKNGKPAGFSVCIPCTLAYQHGRNQLPGVVLRNREYAYRHKLRTDYGIELEEYDRLNAEQNGLCAICHEPETALGRGRVVKPLAVDHDHITGKVRGLLCHRCNSVLGNAKDSPERLEEAARYLRRGPNFQVK